MVKLTASVFLVALLRVIAVAQEMPEYGDLSELNGKHTVYVMSPDSEARKAIVKQIEEYIQNGKIDAKVVGSTDEASIIILYARAGGHATFGGYQLRGELAVAIRGRAVKNTESGVGGQKYRARILYTTRQSRGYSAYGITLDKSAHKKAIRKFLDEWSKLQKKK